MPIACRIIAIYLSLSLAACGGGGGRSSAPPAVNFAPAVNAGTDQTVLAGATVNLAGTATDTDGSVVSCSWEQTSGDSVSLSGASSATASFTMPEQPASTSLQFRLTCTDNQGKTASDSIVIQFDNQAPSVSAGADRTVAAGSTVTLTATASDTDGSIASYSWQQTTGNSVTLTNADTATASFTVPNGQSGTRLAFSLTVTDNHGATASDNLVIDISGDGSPVTITGTVTFDLVPFNTSSNGLDYPNTQSSPSRGVLVEAVDQSATVLASSTTDANGQFLLTVNPSLNIQLRVSAKMLQTNGVNWDIKVTDNTNGNALYAAQGQLFNSGTGNSTRNLHLTSGWGGNSYTATRAAAPFAILDALYVTVEKFTAVDATLVFPPLEIRWSENNSVAEGKLEEGDIGTSFYQQGKIYILGKQNSDTDEYDRHIIIHEWGHYFEDKLSRSDSIGGSHGSGDRLDLRVAFGEGWGNALSAMMTDDPFYRDSSGSQQAAGWSINIDSNSTSNPGWFSEDSIQSILYDLYDNSIDGQDGVSLGLQPIYQALTSENYRNTDLLTSIYTFSATLKSQQPSSASAIDQLLQAQDIFGLGAADGAGESNDGGISSVLPVYNTVTVNGESIAVCSVDDAGAYNKLGNVAFIQFQAASAGDYLIRVTDTAATPVSDPDLRLLKAGVTVGSSESDSTGEEIASLNLTSAGTHILEIWDYNNRLEEGDNRGDYCFDLQITH